MILTAQSTGLLMIVALAAAPFDRAQQTPADAATGFQVASIRPSLGGKSSNMSTSPDTLTIGNVALRTIIAAAYRIADYQIAGPEWLKKERFDIVAKTGAPIAADDMLPMLQPLLAERFRLAVHRETRQLPAYVLTVAKGGAEDGSGRSGCRCSTVQEGHEKLGEPHQRAAPDDAGTGGDALAPDRSSRA